MPNKLRSKLKQNEFFCVVCGKRVKANADDMYVKVFKNKRVKGGVPALRARCDKCEYNLTKFIKHADKDKMVKKYGK